MPQPQTCVIIVTGDDTTDNVTVNFKFHPELDLSEGHVLTAVETIASELMDIFATEHEITSVDFD